MKIRSAMPDDAPRLLAIYGYYVEKTAVSFEYETPTEAEFRARISDTLKKYPYLVLENRGNIVGYSYAGVFKARKAYDRCAELTVYLDKEEKGKGYGRMLYTALEERLKAQGITNLYACIASPITEDETLTHASEKFHAALGFEAVGTFRRCGYKFGRDYNMVWMEKLI